MLKKTIKYRNFNDQEVEETHFFHLSKADIIEMQVSAAGGLDTLLQRAIDSGDNLKILQVFKDIIRRSYGVKTDDGRFIKKSDLTEEFLAGEAYSELLMEMMTDASFAAEFARNIVPHDIEATAARIETAAQAQQANGATPPSTPETPALDKASAALATEEPAATEDPTGLTTPVTPQVLTPADLADIDSDELKSGLATGRYKIAS